MPQSPRTLKILTIPSIDQARKKIEVFFFFFFNFYEKLHIAPKLYSLLHLLS